MNPKASHHLFNSLLIASLLALFFWLSGASPNRLNSPLRAYANNQGIVAFSGPASRSLGSRSAELQAAGGIIIEETGGSTNTTEGGASDTYRISLAELPSGQVTITFNTGDQISPIAALTFNESNWDTPQDVTVTAVDDLVAEGPHTGTISHEYNGEPLLDTVAVNISDNDEEGIIIDLPAVLETGEDGSWFDFSVRLATQPTSEVTINLSSSDTGEGTVAPALRIFTAANWDQPQTARVTGVDDDSVDGPQAYEINVLAQSSDAFYNNLSQTIPAVNNDNDIAGINVILTSGLETSESGSSMDFSVRLTSQPQPSSEVTINLSSSNDQEGVVSPTTDVLNFTPGDWDIPQTVTVSGVDDFVDDGDQAYQIVADPSSSSDSNYNSLSSVNIDALNLDDDTASVIIVDTSGLITTEGGVWDTFTVVLGSQPKNSVTIGLSVSNPSEGSVLPTSLVFGPEPGGWDTPQTVTVTGEEDYVLDGAINYTVNTSISSADSTYAALDVADVSVVNYDNDSPANILITPTTITTNEKAGSVSFLAVLTTKPSSDVTIPLRSSDTSEGTLAVTSLTFTKDNYDINQTVSIEILDDPVDDGDVSFAIITDPAISADPRYSNLDSPDVTLINVDDDQAGILANPNGGLVTGETGLSNSFQLSLTSQPQGPVTIDLSSSNTSEGTVTPASLSFTVANWDQPQSASATGVDDDLADGNQSYAINLLANSSDPLYDNLSQTIGATNSDNDSAGITVNRFSGLVTTEIGGTAAFSVTLNTRPLQNVSIAFTSSNPAEGSIASTVPLVFTPLNWNKPQKVLLKGVDDAAGATAPNDGDQLYEIIPSPSQSGDERYNGMALPPIQALNEDNDGPKLAWVLPIKDKQIYPFKVDQGAIKLQVELKDSFDKTTQVYFLWWDARKRVYVNLGIPAKQPQNYYELIINPRILNKGWNQVFTLGIDNEGDTSTDPPFIWLFRVYRVFSPMILQRFGR